MVGYYRLLFQGNRPKIKGNHSHTSGTVFENMILRIVVLLSILFEAQFTLADGGLVGTHSNSNQMLSITGLKKSMNPRYQEIHKKIDQTPALIETLKEMHLSPDQATEKFLEAEDLLIVQGQSDLNLGTLAICAGASFVFMGGAHAHLCTTLFNSYIFYGIELSLYQLSATVAAIYFHVGDPDSKVWTFASFGLGGGGTIYGGFALGAQIDCEFGGEVMVHDCTLSNPGGFLGVARYGVGGGIEIGGSINVLRLWKSYF